METDLRKLSLDVISPLCPATQKFFNKLRIDPEERIRLSMSTDMRHFKAEFFSFKKHWQTGQVQRCAPGYNTAVRFPQRIPERRNLEADRWQFGATDLTALLIHYHWRPEQISFADEVTRSQYKYLLANFLRQTYGVQNRENLEGFRFLDSPEFKLGVYQKKALRASMFTEGFGYFMEQGTGKTAVAIARICNESLRKKEVQYRVLIVCPKNVRTNWEEEFHKFSTVAGRVTVVRGDKLNRYKCIVEAMQKPAEDSEEKFTAVIISYDSVERTFEPLKMIEWDLCILDESHYIKNSNTKRWKALRKLRDRCKARMCLTGTPITNTMLDLYTQFEFMGDNWSGFTSYNSFKSFYGKFAKVSSSQNQAGYKKLIGLDNIPMIQERLARQAFLIKKSDALPDLPQKTYDICEVSMTKEQTEVYKNVCAEIAVELEDELNSTDNPVLVVNNMLTKMLRLAQITSGFVGISEVLDEEGEVIQEAIINRFDPNPKIDSLVEILKTKEPYQKTIIWACWVQDIRSIAARLRLEGIDAVTYYGATSDVDRATAVSRFNCDSTCKVFIGNAAAGGTGINLLGYDLRKKYNGKKPKTYCDHVIYFSQNWSPTARSQSEDRAHRRGTVGHVQYTDLMVPLSIDHEIREAVVNKRLNAMKIQDVRRIVERMKGK